MPIPSAYPLDSLFGAPAPFDGDTPSPCLVSFDADDALLVSRAGDALSYACATPGTFVDSNGLVRRASPNQPRWYALDLDGDGRRETLGLLLERPSTNRVTWSEDATHWTLGNVTATAAWLALGDVTLPLLATTAPGFGSVAAAVTALAGDGVKAVSVIVAPGPTAAPTGAQVSCTDNTAGTHQLLAGITWDTTGAPVVVAVFGTYLGAEALGRGAWRLCFQTAAVVAANGHTCFVYPAVVAGESGSLVAGAWQVEDQPLPTSYLPTAGAAASRTVETCTLARPLWLPRDHTLYAELARPLWAGRATGQMHIPLALGQTGVSGTMLDDATTGVLGAIRYDAGVVAAPSVAAPAATVSGRVNAERLAWAAQASGWDRRAQPPAMIVTAAGGAAGGAAPAGTAPFAAWPADLIRLHGWDDAGASAPDAVLLAVRVAAGLRPLDEMRGLR